MADSITNISNLVQTSVPKVSIQRIVLETGAPPVKVQKDPHIVLPNELQPPTNTDTSFEKLLRAALKIDLTLSLKGFGRRNLKSDNLLSDIFDNLNLMKLLKTSVYQIDNQGLKNLGIAAGFANMFGSPGNPNGVGTGVSYQEIYNLIKDSPLDIVTKKEINIFEELSSLEEGDLARFSHRTSDGSTFYNFPFRLDTFVSLNPDPKFLAYMVVTEVDNDMLINHIKETIGGSADYQLPTEVEQYLQTLNVDISNKSISFDIVINNSGVNDQAALLQRTDTQEIWFGGYHEMQDGTLMTGATHNDQTLAAKDRDVVLRPVLMANTKIVDLRDDEEIEKVFLKELYELENVFEAIQKATNQPKTTTEKLKLELPEKFSTSYMSKGFDGTHSYLFAVDKLKVLANKSLLARIGQNLLNSNTLVNDLKEKILGDSVIKQLRIFRRRVKVDGFGQNRLGTPNINQESFKHNVLDADVENYYEDVIPKRVAILRDGLKKIEGLSFLETALDEKRYCYYSFKDTELNNIKHGNYEYFYELVLEDGIRKTLTEKIKFLSLYYEDIKSYYDFINTNIEDCYSDLTDQFNFSFLQAQGYGDIGSTLANIVGQMSDILKMFNPQNASSYGMMNKKLLIISNPISGNIQGLIKFINTCETFISKIQSLSGIKTGLNKHLDLAVTNLNTETIEVPNTVKVTEVFADNANLENINAGYEYIIANDLIEDATKADSKNSIRTISTTLYLSMANAQLQENFLLDETNTSPLGNISNPNKLRYFTPTQVFIDNRKYLTNSLPTSNSVFLSSVLKPFRVDFDYYKPIILDILEYYHNKNMDSKLISMGEKNNIRKLIDIAGRYGVLFDNSFVKQLDYLSDPAKDENSEKYSDSSKLKNNQQQTSKNTSLSAFQFTPEVNEASDYEDNTFESDLSQNIENFLFGMVSNIVLKDESLIPEKYKGPDLSGYQQLPICLQALITQFAPQGVQIKQYLAGQPQLGFGLFKETPLSLNTIGWWWFNYSNVVEVRYLERYDSFFNPVWTPLTSDSFNNLAASDTPKRIICKLYKYENSAWGIRNNNKFLELPILNEYFIIDPGEATVTAVAEKEALLAIDQEDETDVETKTKQDLDDIIVLGNSPDLKSAISTDPKVVQNKNAVRINRVAETLVSQARQQTEPVPTRAIQQAELREDITGPSPRAVNTNPRAINAATNAIAPRAQEPNREVQGARAPQDSQTRGVTEGRGGGYS